MPKLIRFTPSMLTRTSERRKVGPAEVVLFTKAEKDTPIVIEPVADRIVRDWDRGVDTRQLAKQYGIKRLDVERVIHERRNAYRRVA